MGEKKGGRPSAALTSPRPFARVDRETHKTPHLSRQTHRAATATASAASSSAIARRAPIVCRRAGGGRLPCRERVCGVWLRPCTYTALWGKRRGGVGKENTVDRFTFFFSLGPRASPFPAHPSAHAPTPWPTPATFCLTSGRTTWWTRRGRS